MFLLQYFCCSYANFPNISFFGRNFHHWLDFLLLLVKSSKMSHSSTRYVTQSVGLNGGKSGQPQNTVRNFTACLCDVTAESTEKNALLLLLLFCTLQWNQHFIRKTYTLLIISPAWEKERERRYWSEDLRGFRCPGNFFIASSRQRRDIGRRFSGVVVFLFICYLFI